MPSVKVKTPAGYAHFHYAISTPTNMSAKAIDKNLPTLIFLHPVYMAQDVFQNQFSDPQLRRFNLVVLDFRGHGETVGKVTSTYGREEAAHDVAKFMDALKLPPSHFMGVSMGACIGLQLAILYPARVLSLCMVSPLPLTEPEDVAAGRQEIHDCWVEGFRDPSKIDHAALLDSVYGALQLGFNGVQTSLVSALTARALPQAMKNWVSAPGKFDVHQQVTVEFFVKRVPQPHSQLVKVKCPIVLIQCGDDIAYPVEYAEEVLQSMKNAALDVTLFQVNGAPHFGHLTHPKEINHIFHDLVVRHTSGGIPPVPQQVISPFQAGLIKAGWNQEESDDEDM